MSIISLNCPHDGCRLEKAAYVIRAVNNPLPNIYECFSTCPGCHKSAIVVLATAVQGLDFVNVKTNALSVDKTVVLHSVTPGVAGIDIPDHVPEKLHSSYEQAFDNLQRGNWDAAGMMFRKTLETAVKHLHSDGKGNLYQRIEGLPADIGVTDAMKKWAHEIRDLGNDAAHEDPETEEDAKAIYNFTNVFLRYAFTMPGMMEERRGEPDAE